MPVLRLLTWNLGPPGVSFDALDKLCDHVKRLVARGDSFVVALQECPQDQAWLRGQLPTCSIAGETGRVIISSMALRDIVQHERMVVTRLTFAQQDLVIACYHGVDRLNHTDDVARGGRVSEFRWLLDAYCGHDDAIIMGDFNAEPESSEVQNRWCFGFGRDKPGSCTSHGRTRSRFRVVRPSGRSGTIRWQPPGGEERWYAFDFVAVTESLLARTTCSVENIIDGESIVDLNGFPALGDHLPVIGEVS